MDSINFWSASQVIIMKFNNKHTGIKMVYLITYFEKSSIIQSSNKIKENECASQKLGAAEVKMCLK